MLVGSGGSVTLDLMERYNREVCPLNTHQSGLLIQGEEVD